MTDFRQQFYERYVSTFKDAGASSTERVHGAWEWARCKWLPLLDHVDRRGPILDLGCGAGYYLELLVKEGFTNAVGVDVSSEQVRLAQERGLHAIEGDVLTHLESHRGKYEAILAIDLIEHFAKDELLRLTAAIHAALRPGGTLLLQTPNGAGLFAGLVVHGDLTHMTIFNEGSLEQLLRLAGFASVECFEGGPAPRNLSGRLRIAVWAIIRAAASLARTIETGYGQRIWTDIVICRSRRPDGGPPFAGEVRPPAP